MEGIKPVVKKLREIFELGYVPSRRGESYYYKTQSGDLTKDLVNCFGHACFNLTNEMFDKFDITIEDKYDMQAITGRIDSLSKKQVSLKLLDFVRDIGLMVERCPKEAKLKANQWKIALYFDQITFGKETFLRDFHFMKQENDNSWTSKISFTSRVAVEEDLPKQFTNYYRLYDVYKITNPHAKIER